MDAFRRSDPYAFGGSEQQHGIAEAVGLASAARRLLSLRGGSRQGRRSASAVAGLGGICERLQRVDRLHIGCTVLLRSVRRCAQQLLTCGQLTARLGGVELLTARSRTAKRADVEPFLGADRAVGVGGKFEARAAECATRVVGLRDQIAEIQLCCGLRAVKLRAILTGGIVEH